MCVVSFVTAAPVLAQTAAPEKLATIEGITEYRLQNGLHILLFPDPSSANVTVNLTVLVGSRHEGYGETGMAHLLEHMLFKGTPQHPEVPRALKDHGARFNGTTWLDRTNYFETMTGTDANLEFGIRLEADRLVNSFVRREDLASEMTVVRSEFEMGENSPDNVLSQRMMATAYEWHNYGKSTIGNRSDIERVPIENLQAFYRKYYQPDNAVLVVAGKFDEKKALNYIAKYFGAIKKPARKLDATYTEEPPQDGERTVILRRVGKVGVVGAIYHVPAAAHEDFPAVEVLNNILVSEPSGLLYKDLVETKKASNVSGMAYGLHDPGVLEISAQVDKDKKLDEVREPLLHSLEQLGSRKFTQEEVDRAKRQLLKQRELLLTQSNRIGTELSEWVARGDWRLFFLHRDRLEKVTPQDVQRVAGKYLVRSNRTVGLYIPTDKAERAPVPETPAIASLVKDYKGRADLAAGEAFEPTAENIVRREQTRELEPSGVKVALLPKKTRGQIASMLLVLRYGNEQSLNGHTTAAKLLPEMMTRGTQKHTRQQLQDELDKLGARLSATGDTGELHFSIMAKRDKLAEVVRLLREIVREPSLPDNELDVLKREMRDQFEKGMTEPTALAMRDFQRRLSPYPKDNIRYVPTLEESLARLQAVSIEELRTLYREQVGGRAGELVLVGDFDQEPILKQFGEMLNGWKASTPYERIAKPAKTDVAGSREVILTPDKANAFFVTGEALAMRDDNPDFAALEIGNYLFGGGPLSSRLANRVRQQQGLSYTVRSQFSADALDANSRLIMYAICNPANIDKVDQAFSEEIAKLLKDGATAKEVAEAGKAYLAAETVQRANDGMLARVLAENLTAGRTFEYYVALEKKIASLTAEQVNQALRKHFDPKRLVTIRAGDFAKK
jgi:zinc protease